MTGTSGAHGYEQLKEQLERDRIVRRIFERDFTVWSESPDEIAARLGWLDCPAEMQKAIPELESFAAEVREEGITDVVLLGMGGSSLAAEVIQDICGNQTGYPAVQVIDTTDPLTIGERQKHLDPEQTLFIVATKSGGTVETISLLNYFYRWVAEAVGTASASKYFVAITDPGSGLEATARELSFRRIFINDPDIGGRYSALSYFGLVPAALAGIDIAGLLDSASGAMDTASAELGAFLGGAALVGCNKLTIISDKSIRSFGAWLEQLIAESSGKHGRGILPITGERWLAPREYGDDRCIVALHECPDSPAARHGETLDGAGLPVIAVPFAGAGDLGAQFFNWELATAVACHVTGVNPFDQPDVEQAKVIAREAMQQHAKSGSLPSQQFVMSHDGIHIGGNAFDADTLAGLFRNLIATAKPGGYICLQAFMPELPAVETAIGELSASLRELSRLPVVFGFGPRYLHSTGQLHKGGFAGGLFIQLTCEDRTDIDIPDAPAASRSSATFGLLKQAQAMGDYQALVSAGRKVLACHLDEHLVGLARLIALVKDLPGRASL